MTYSEKLKHPKWQKKRLEILQRDNFTCRHCGDTETTLHVHHEKYTGKNPWDADNDDLITICLDCHEVNHLGLSEFEYTLVDLIRIMSKRADDRVGFMKDVNEYIKSQF